MNRACLSWFKRHVTKADVLGRKVLEVGSRDVNGSVRSLFTQFAPVRYIGVDIADGPGVDVICDGAELTDRFGLGRFDIVVSTFALEHMEHAYAVMKQMRAACAEGGLIFIAVPEKWPEHNYPGDYHRFTACDIVDSFHGDAWHDEVLIAETEDQPKGRSVVYAKIRKSGG